MVARWLSTWVGVLLLWPQPARAQAAPPLLVPPVDAPIQRRFDPPATTFGSGHRGIDLAASPGASVRAAAAGSVVFAGRVAGHLAVTIEHLGGLATTYSLLRSILVHAGDTVGQGYWIGTTEASHTGSGGGLHLGVKLNGFYVDPEDYLGPIDVSRAIHLAPLAGSAGSAESPSPGGREALAGCAPAPVATGSPPPPNDNIVVLVAGIGTQTRGASGPFLFDGFASQALGYAPGDVYEFSYRGTNGRRWHADYERRDTYGSLVAAARRLRQLLERIGGARPGTSVDIVAHSQGGIVTRVLLEKLAHSWDPSLPPVEHVVTMASPHRGTPAAELPRALDDGPLGSLLLDTASALARRGWLPLPADDSEAVTQLRPASSLMAALAAEDVLFGSRVLSLAMPHDLIVPAPASELAGENTHLVPPEGLFGHSSILGSRPAQEAARAFLRDAPPPCPSLWQGIARAAGRAISGAHKGLAWALSAVQSAPGSPLAPLRLLRWLG